MRDSRNFVLKKVNELLGSKYFKLAVKVKFRNKEITIEGNIMFNIFMLNTMNYYYYY